MPIINQVVKGGGSTKYGVSVDAFLGSIDQNGVLQRATPGNVVLTGPTDLADSAMAAAFSYSEIVTFSAPTLAAISGTYALQNTFLGSKVQAIYLDGVVEISGTSALEYACRYTSYLTTLSMASLVRISGAGAFSNFATAISGNVFSTVNMPLLAEVTGAGALSYWLVRCTSLTTLSLPSLTKVTGSNAFQRAFDGSGITTLTLGGTSAIDFGGQTDSFTNMFNNCSQNITVNAPAASRTDIEAMTGYPNFGGTGTVTWNWVS